MKHQLVLCSIHQIIWGCLKFEVGLSIAHTERHVENAISQGETNGVPNSSTN